MRNISSQTVIGEGPGHEADAFVFLCGGWSCGTNESWKPGGKPLDEHYGSMCRTRGLSMNEKMKYATKTAQVISI